VATGQIYLERFARRARGPGEASCKGVRSDVTDSSHFRVSTGTWHAARRGDGRMASPRGEKLVPVGLVNLGATEEADTRCTRGKLRWCKHADHGITRVGPRLVQPRVKIPPLSPLRGHRVLLKRRSEPVFANSARGWWKECHNVVDHTILTHLSQPRPPLRRRHAQFAPRGPHAHHGAVKWLQSHGVVPQKLGDTGRRRRTRTVAPSSTVSPHRGPQNRKEASNGQRPMVASQRLQ
jgi:hypothetical protein